jgi:hypothetical protein
VIDESLHDAIKNRELHKEPPYECTVIYQCER